MSEYICVITFSDFKNESMETQNFGNDWGLFIDIDDDNTNQKKETYIFFDLESENNLYTDWNSTNKNNYFDYLYYFSKIAVGVFISAIFICVVIYF